MIALVLGAVAGALLLVLVPLLARLRRMESTVSELRNALESGSLDLDEVLTQVLQAAVSVASADAATLSLDSAGGTPLTATLGLSTEEAERQTIAVPVSFDGQPIGVLTVFARAPRELPQRAVLELEQLARRAGPALGNARRYREARQLADLDALTSLHNRRYFHETLAREVARAHRYERRLALVVVDVDDFKAVNDRIGHLAGDAVLAEVAERVRSVVRSADIACRIGGDEFAVIMPESSALDAEQLSERLQAAVAARAIVLAGRLEVSAGVAELRQGDDASTLFERADEGLYGAKESGKGRVVSANGDASAAASGT